MRATRAAAVSIAIACTGTHRSPPRPPPPSIPGLPSIGKVIGNDGWGPITEMRSTPQPFLGEPTLREVTITTYRPGEWGSSTVSHTEVRRDDRVVCDLPAGASGAEEDHWFRSTATVSPVPGTPLQFDLREQASRNEDVGSGSHERCTRYEIPPAGTCHVVSARECELDCKPEVTAVQRPGSGLVTGTVTYDGEAIAGIAVLASDQQQVLTDDAGGFSFPAGASATLTVFVVDQRAQIALHPRPDRDTVVTVTAITCTCCSRIIPAPAGASAASASAAARPRAPASR